MRLRCNRTFIVKHNLVVQRGGTESRVIAKSRSQQLCSSDGLVTDLLCKTVEYSHTFNMGFVP